MEQEHFKIPAPAAAAPGPAPTDHYRISVDLSHIRLGGRESLSVVAKSGLGIYLRDIPDDVTINVLPVVVGDGVKLDDASKAWRPLRVRKVALSTPAPTKLSGQSPYQWALAGSVLDSASDRSFAISSTGPGCAAFALSVWDENLDRPLDHLVFPIAVGNVECALDVNKSAVLSSEMLALWSGPRDSPPSAALHVFEFELAQKPKSVAVFAAPGLKPVSWLSWELETLISRAMTIRWSAAAKLARKLPYESKTVSARVVEDLFPPDNDAATLALTTIRSLASGAPVLYARVVDKTARNLPVPLGLLNDKLNKAPIGRTVLVTGPLPTEFYRAETKTAGPFVILRAKAPPSADEVNNWVDARKYLTGCGAPPAAAESLVLVAHHGDEVVGFNSTTLDVDGLAVTGLKRRYAPGSIGVLLLCTVAKSGALVPMTLLEKFGERMDALLVSPFQLQEGFANAFVDSLKARSQEHREAKTATTLRAFIDEVIQHLPEGQRDEAYELVLIGNPSIQLFTEGAL